MNPRPTPVCRAGACPPPPAPDGDAPRTLVECGKFPGMALGKNIAFLGAGNMAEALVKGLLRAGVAEPREIVCSDRNEARGPELIQRYGVRFTRSNREAVEQCEVVVLSVKP